MASEIKGSTKVWDIKRAGFSPYQKELQQALVWVIESLRCLIDSSVSGYCSFQPIIFNDNFIRYNEKDHQTQTTGMFTP